MWWFKHQQPPEPPAYTGTAIAVAVTGGVELVVAIVGYSSKDLLVQEWPGVLSE